MNIPWRRSTVAFDADGNAVLIPSLVSEHSREQHQQPSQNETSKIVEWVVWLVNFAKKMFEKRFDKFHDDDAQCGLGRASEKSTGTA